MRHKFGIKLYMLTEPCGVTLKTLVYTGAIDATSGKGHMLNVSGHSVSLDNFYNSFELADKLNKSPVPTVRAN